MIYNLTKKTVLARLPISAETLICRGRGMIGRDFDSFDAMVFERCNNIHTMFMSIAIDIIFVDFDNRVCDFRSSVNPWRPLIRCGKARAVIELPVGAIANSRTSIGDVLDLNAVLSDKEEKKLAEEILSSAETVMPFQEENI